MEPSVPEKPDSSPDDPAVIHDAASPVLQGLPEVMDLAAPILDAVEQPRASQSGEKDPEGHIEDDLGIEPLALGAPPGQPCRGDEGQHQHDAVSIDRELAMPDERNRDRYLEQDRRHATGDPPGPTRGTLS